MDEQDLNKVIEEARNKHFEKLLAYRKWYDSPHNLPEDGLAVMEQIPENVSWELKDNCVTISGEVEGLKEMTFIIQAFAHDENYAGVFYENFLLLKSDSPIESEDFTVIAMPDEAWGVWGGKMADVAWGHDFDNLTFNSLGFYEEKLPVDIGIRLGNVD